MFKHYLGPYFRAEGQGGTGTTGTSSASRATSVDPMTTRGGVTSGTASEALIKAATAASSADTKPDGQADTGTTSTGDTNVGAQPGAGGEGDAAATAAREPQQPVDGQGKTPDPALQGRFQSVARNARRQVVTDIAQHFGMDPRTFGTQGIETLGRAMNLLRHINKSPLEFAKQLVSELGGEWAKAGQLPYGGNRELPKPRLRAEDGTPAYSADEMLKIIDIKVAEALEHVDGRIRPLSAFQENYQEQTETAQNYEQTRRQYATALREARTWPEFRANEDAIAQELATMRDEEPELIQQLGVPAALYRCYARVMGTRVLPGRDAAVEKRIREADRKKQNTSAGQANPADTSAAVGSKAKLRDGDTDGLAAHMRKLEQSMGAST